MAKIKCPKCGTEMEEGSRFCTSCGLRLGSAALASAPKPEAPKPEAPKPEAPKPEAMKPESPKPEPAPDPRYKPVERAVFENTSSLPAVRAEESSPAPAAETSPAVAPAYAPARQQDAAPDVRPSVKVSRQKPVKKQTVPERILNVIGSILICLVMIAQASVAIAAEFADTVATRESVERIVAGMDVSSIMIEGKSLPETVIGGFGLDYDILGLIGVSEEKINSAFAGVTSLAASRLGQVAGRIREGSDVEDVTLVSRDEIMEILRSNDSIISSLQLPGLTGQIYDVIDRGLVEAGFGDGLTVGKIFDSLGESGAAGLKAAVAAAHAAVRSFTYIKFTFGAACAALIAALFILNKRRLRASFFWCGISCGIVAAGLLAAHFSWIQFSRIDSVAALSLALQPVGVDFTLRYGVILAASCAVCLALSVVCAVVGSRTRRKRRGM